MFNSNPLKSGGDAPLSLYASIVYEETLPIKKFFMPSVIIIYNISYPEQCVCHLNKRHYTLKDEKSILLWLFSQPTMLRVHSGLDIVESAIYHRLVPYFINARTRRIQRPPSLLQYFLYRSVKKIIFLWKKGEKIDEYTLYAH